MKRRRLLILLLIVSCVSFIYDRNRYYIGRSIIDYKSLPVNLKPDYISESIPSYETEKHFCLIYNGCESFGYGFAYVYNLDGLRNQGLETKNVFSVKETIGYYYDEKRIFIICLDRSNKIRCVTPYWYKNDTIFVEVPFPEKKKSLRYVNTVNI